MKLFILNFVFILLLSQSYGTGKINVKNFGAKGDGKTNDTKAIQSAINAANFLAKTTIYFPAGTYIIGSYTSTSNYLENYCLLLHSNLDITGDGDQTVIKLADHIFDKTDSNANAHIFYGSKVKNISFSDLMIDMNGINNLVPAHVIKNHSAIFTSVGENYYIHDITIKNCSGTNMINIMSKGSRLVIENNRFINGGNYVGDPEPNKNQIDFSFVYSEWDSTMVRNNIIQQQNIDIGLGNYSGGIEIHGSYSTVSDNLIDGCWPALFITSSRELLKNVLVQNNKMINCVIGISFWLMQPMQDISILNNEIGLTHSRSAKLNLCAGIIMPNGNSKEYNKNLANAAPVYNLKIEGNTITAESMDNLSAGIVIHSLQESSIQNNVITGMNYGGIVMSGSKWGTNSLQINDNSFIDFKPNNDKNAVSGYLVITDTYSPRIKDAPGFKNIVFNNNKFIRSDNNPQLQKTSKGIFFGGFIALPSKMIEEIKFTNNNFTIPSENLHIVKTDQ